MKTIGTYATKKEAQAALDTYFYVPETRHDMTLKEAFEGWKQVSTVAETTKYLYTSGFKKLTRIHNVNVADLTLDMMQDAVNTSPMTFATANAIKKLLSVSLEYAYVHDCCPAGRKELLQYIQLPEKIVRRERKIFTDDEIQACLDQKAYGAVILLFTGMRREEFLTLTEDNIHLDEGWIHVSKSKTSAGVRDIPLPDRLIPIFKAYMESPLFGKSRAVFETYWKNVPVLKNHVRHECRHTYITKLTEAGVDQRVIKLIVGHAGTITEDVYTHYSMDMLRGIVNDVFSSYLPAEFSEDGTALYELSA